MAGKKKGYPSRRRRRRLVDAELSADEGVAILEAAGVPYALAGYLAVVHYIPASAERHTKDADFAVPYGYSDKAAKAAEEAGYSVKRLPIGGYQLTKPGVVIDLIDRHPRLDQLFADAVKVAQEQRKDPEDVPVVPLAHLIAMKMVSGSRKDTEDVEHMLMEVADGDYPAIRKTVDRYLGIAAVERLDDLARSVGIASAGRRYKN
ncbi:MAG: hypothetical protein ACYSU0_17340 [Planctomycetota bacterium]